MKRAVIAERNASITLAGARVVVAGGTQGIGEGIANRFAQAGAEVWIVGRNESKANAVLARLEEISQEKKIEPAPKHHFIKADLSLVAQAKRVAHHIRTRAGVGGVDYLVLCQGGPPNGSYILTSEGIEQHYAVQVLSRFVLAYMLAVEPDSEPVVTKGVLFVMSPGRRPLAVDYEDLDMRKANERGSYGILACGSRDSAFVDNFTEEMARRAPSIAFTHVFPGYVQTDVTHNSAIPWYLASIIRVYLFIAGDTPASYADVPFYLLAHPEGRAATLRVRFWNENVEEVRVEERGSKALSEKEIRIKIWEHLLEQMTGRMSA